MSWRWSGLTLLAAAALLCTAARAADEPADYERLRREHWAWQPVRAAQPPAVKDAAWPAGEIDRFILARLESEGLRPVGDADRVTLIRRVTFDLTGLPPTPEEVEAFVKDMAPDAYAKVVDRLLASPAFGEKWARHWLDAARYAESTGSSRNFPYPHAWRYRDYVIDSFNADKPYDRFITEQVAGDLLPHGSPVRRNEQLIATGFLALGVKDLNERDPAKFAMDNVDEQIDVVGRAVLGLTIACARCHDHKFDPIPTGDYYAVAGIFRSTTILTGLSSRRGGGNRVDVDLLAKLAEDPQKSQQPQPAVDPKVVAEHERRVKALTARLEQARADMRAARNRHGKGQARPMVMRQRQLARRLADELESLRAQRPAAAGGTGPVAIAVRDDPKPADCRVHVRGETDSLGPAVPRGFISLVRLPGGDTIDRNQSGRLELARWLTHYDNPLTARVMANRVWHHLFGRGLVRTLDNFGTTGEKPSHPQLLDHLATRFQANDWSTKKLIREIVLSRTYRLAGAHDGRNAAVDTGNVLLWRSSTRRLEAEAVRDAMLAAGGQLDRGRPAGSPVMNLPYVEIRNLNPGEPRRGQGRRARRMGLPEGQGQGVANNARSVYLPVVRGLVPPALEVFDFAEPSLSTGGRDVTTVATQALFLMNNPFVLEQSRHLARRVLEREGLDDAGRVDLAYRLALGRAATDAERARAMEFVRAYEAEAGAKGKETQVSGARFDAWGAMCQALFASAEFRFLD